MFNNIQQHNIIQYNTIQYKEQQYTLIQKFQHSNKTYLLNQDTIITRINFSPYSYPPK